MKSINWGVKFKKLNSYGRTLTFLIAIFFSFQIANDSFAEGFTASTLGDYGNVSVMEVGGVYDAKFADGTENRYARQQVAKEFYKTHSDDYDFIVFFSNFDYGMLDEHTAAFYHGVRNNVTGIGQELFDHSSTYGSEGTLQGTIDMGNVLNHAANYETVSDPLDPEFNDTLSVLSHEILHRWGAKLKFKDESGSVSDAMLGKDGAHWSFLFDSNGSVLYGNEWNDNGDGTFTSLAPRKEMKHYGPLDLYLMGMLEKSKVPPMLLIDSPDVDKNRLPEAGVTISGTARTITIDDIIAAEGERAPTVSEAQKSFKTAFIYVTRPGTFAAKDLVGIEAIRNSFVTRFSILTDGAAITQVAATSKDDIPASPGVTLPETTPRTTDADINEGVAWLISHQETDGSWRDLLRTAGRDTAQSYMALLDFDLASGSLPSALEWLGLSDPANTDYLARKVTALAEGGNDASAELEKLLAMQNIDGGWGSSAGYASSPADTALALKAILSAGTDATAATEPVTKGMAYLKSSQNINGGWGSGSGSDVQTTSSVLSLFGQKRDLTPAEENIGAGTTWLMAKQNPDGGFGNSPSTVYNTAEALLALKELGAPSQVSGAALDYILAKQSGDGSWNASPYETALAVSAVWKASVDPDLSIKSEDITFIPEKITSLPANIVIKADINNLGRTDVQQARVVLYDGDAIPENMLGEQSLAFPGESSTAVTFSANVEEGRDYIFRIVVDADGVIEESSESNNVAVKILKADATYDLEVLPANLSLSAAEMDKYQELTISSVISNKGTMDAYNVQVRYFVDEEGAPHDIATLTIEVVPANSSVISEVTWIADKAGTNLPIRVEADPFNNFTELSEENNSAVKELTVNNVILTDPNLTISHEDIAMTPNPAHKGGSAVLSALIKNIGYSAASDIVVSFYSGVPDKSGVLIGSHTIAQLNVGDSVTASVEWKDIPDDGDKLIYVQVDPAGLINETNEEDNEAFTTVNILSLPELVVGDGSIDIDPALPKGGDKVTISVTVQNQGEQDAKDVAVQLLDGETVVATKVVPLIGGDGQLLVSFEIPTVTDGIHSLTILVDPADLIVEQDENNNSAVRIFGVQDAEMWVSERYISPNGDGVKDSTGIFFKFDKEETVKVEILDEKGETIRTFSGPELERIWIGDVLWDGLLDKGTVAEDGEYTVRIVSVDGVDLGATNIIVDNNRTPFSDAFGTKYLKKYIYPYAIPGADNGNMKVVAPEEDESGFIMKWSYDNWNHCDGDNKDVQGIYKLWSDGGYFEKLDPLEWLDLSACNLQFNVAISPDSDRIAASVRGWNKIGYFSWIIDWGHLWTYRKSTSEWNKIDANYSDSYGDDANIGAAKFSPDGNRLAYYGMGAESSGGIFSIGTDGSGKTLIDEGVHYHEWSPSGGKIAYIKRLRDEESGSAGWQLWVSDPFGNKEMVYDSSIYLNLNNDEIPYYWISDDKILLADNYWLNDSFRTGKLSLLSLADNNSVSLLDDNARTYSFSNDKSHIAISSYNDYPEGRKKVLKVYDIRKNEIIFESERDVTNSDGEPFFGDFSDYAYWSDDGMRFYVNEASSSSGALWTFDLNSKALTWYSLPNVEYKNESALWAADNKTLVIPVRKEGENGFKLMALDVETGLVKEMQDHVSAGKYDINYNSYYNSNYDSNYGWTPLKNSIYFPSSSSLEVVRSLMNLPSGLQVSRRDSMIVLKGTAADINFEGFKLEYADVDAPEEWTLVAPPSTKEVINDDLALWVPPGEGTYFVRLTVWDKAGNVARKLKRVSWGGMAGITDLRKNREFISPNSDGENETVELSYKVLEPVHLEFIVYDDANNEVRTFTKDHSVIGNFYMSWDGKDESLNAVPDGRYRISVSGYDFFVTVDNTPPDANIAVTDIFLYNDSYSGNESYKVEISGKAFDTNIESWILEEGEGDDEIQWVELKAGNDVVVTKDQDGNLVMPPSDTDLSSYGNMGITSLVGKKIRLTVKDLAGNISSSVSLFEDEQLHFLSWSYRDEKPHHYLPGEKFVESAWIGAGPFNEITLFETFATPLQTKVFQYKVGETWHDSEAPIESGEGWIRVTFDPDNIYEDIVAFRLKVTDITGAEHYSEELMTRSGFVLKSPPCEPSFVWVEAASNYISEPLDEIKVRVKRRDGNNEWEDYLSYGASYNKSIPFGEFSFICPTDSASFEMQMIGTDTNFETYSSNIVSLSPKPVIELEVKYPEGGSCGSIPNRANVDTKLFGQAASKYLVYKLDGEIIREVDFQKEKPVAFPIDTATLLEGEHILTATLNYIDPEGKPQEISESNTLIADRTLPTSYISYPTNKTLACPVKYGTSEGGWHGIQVEGEAVDSNNVQKYDLFYNPAGSPGFWSAASTVDDKGEKTPISGEKDKVGTLGVWDISSLTENNYNMRLKVTDLVGNVGCYETAVAIDPLTEIKGVTISSSFISPNGDGYLDDLDFSYTIEEYGEVDVYVTTLAYDSNKAPVFGEMTVRNILSGGTHIGGEASVYWDGMNNSGSTVEDGLYAIHVKTTDGCGNSSHEWRGVEVDRTAPLAEITFPALNDSFGNIVQVVGSATDKNLDHYMLEAGEGEYPDTWRLISSKTSSVDSDVLGNWNTAELTGKWTLRLTVMDKIGNKSETGLTYDIPERISLIKNLHPSLELISPNGDGKLDYVDIHYEIADFSIVEMKIVSSSGEDIKTYEPATLQAGSYNVKWEGNKDVGGTAADGNYSVTLTATKSSNSYISQTEVVSVTVDNTSPDVSIVNPESGAFISQEIVNVTGTIKDPNMADYSVAYSGGSFQGILKEGSQSRENYLFGTVEGAPEGSYSISVLAKDMAENAIEKEISFNIDRTSPQISMDSPLDGEYFGAQKNIIDISGSILEANLDSFELRYGIGESPENWIALGAGGSIPTEVNLAQLEVGSEGGIDDGAYTISLYAIDKAGLENEVVRKVIIDNTPPEISITSFQDGAYIKEPLHVRGTATDENIANYNIELSEGVCASANKWNLLKSSSFSVEDGLLFSWNTLPQDGEYCLRVRAEDKSGNSSKAEYNLKIDIHQPAAPELSLASDDSKTASLSWSANTEADLAGYNLYRNNELVNSQLIQVNAYEDGALDEGTYSYVVKAVDIAGLESEASNSVALRLDYSGPVAKLKFPFDGSRVSGIVEIKGDAYSKDDFREYRIYVGEGVEPLSWDLIRTSPVPVQYGVLTEWETINLPEKTYSVKLEAEDLSGNKITDQAAFIVDNSPPSPPDIISASPTDSNVLVSWQMNTEDDLAGYLLFRDYELVNAGNSMIDSYKPFLLNEVSASYQDEELPDGLYQYYIVAMDDAGNLSDPSELIEVRVDTRPPSAIIDEPLTDTSFESDIYILAVTEDGDVDSVQFEYKRSEDTQWLPLGSPVRKAPYSIVLGSQVLGGNYGYYDLRAVATDVTGKVDPAPDHVTVAYVDLTPPSEPVNVKALANGDVVTITWGPNEEADLAGYNIYHLNRFGQKGGLNTSILTDLEFIHADLDESIHGYEITAVDLSGNESSPSEIAYAQVFRPLIYQPATGTVTDSGDINIVGSGAIPGSRVDLFVDSGSGSLLVGSTIADIGGKFTYETIIPLGGSEIRVQGEDPAGNISKGSNTVLVTYNEPPSAPTGLGAEVTDNDVNLSWLANIEPDLDSYKVYRDGQELEPQAPNISLAILGYGPGMENAIDGDLQTAWESGGGFLDPLQIEFIGGTVSSLNIAVTSPYGPSFSFILYAYGDSNKTYMKVGSDMLNDGWIHVDLPFEARFIMIVPRGMDLLIYEVQVDDGGSSGGPSNDTAFKDLSLPDGTYTYTVTAVDTYGFESDHSESVTVFVGDVTAPSTPTGLTASPSGSDMVMHWSPNSESDLAGYNIYKDIDGIWNKLNQTLIADITLTDYALLNGIYTYRITAVDMVGNESEPSDGTQALIQVDPPMPPVLTSISSLPVGRALHLSWADENNSHLAVYTLFRSLTSGGPYDIVNAEPINGTVYLDEGLVNGMEYYYVVKALDALGNESSFSNELAGIPLNTLPPQSPVITVPTTSSSAVKLYEPFADVAGSVEAGQLVKLFRNDLYIGEMTALVSHKVTTDLSDYMQDISISPDGNKIAYSNPDKSLLLKDFENGEEILVDEYGVHPQWSPDGGKIAYGKTYLEDGQSHIRAVVYDVEGGNIESLTDDWQGSEYYPSWSTDGEKVLMQRGNNVWIKDLAEDTLTQVTTEGNIFYPEFSPDGKSLSYYNNSDKSVYILDLESSNVTILDNPLDPESVIWSPDSSKILALVKNGSLWVISIYDIGHEAWKGIQVSGVNPYFVSWSPDGKKIVYVTREEDPSSGYMESIWLYSLDDGEEKLIEAGLDEVYYTNWLRSTGELVYVNEKSVSKLYPEGYFEFNDVSLEVGDNIIHAVAVNESGKESAASDPISVQFDNKRMPDLTTSESDVYLYPVYPVEGEEVSLNIDVWNRGGSDGIDVNVNIYIWDSNGNLELLKSEVIPSIASGTYESVSARWSSIGKPGENSIIVDIDPDDYIREVTELNNLINYDFIVPKEAGIYILSTLDDIWYRSNQDVGIDIDVINNSNERAVVADVIIVDENGSEVSRFDPITGNMRYGKTEFSFAWNTGNVFPGKYYLKTILSDESGLLEEDTVPFEILPDLSLMSEILINKNEYVDNENVKYSLTINNTGVNYVIPLTNLSAGIRDDHGNVLYEELIDIPYMLPGSSTNIDLYWDTGTYVAGTYHAFVKAYVDDRAMSEDSKVFHIRAVSRVTGDIVDTIPYVLAGNNATFNYIMENSGNDSANGQAVVSIVDPVTGDVILTQDRAVDIAVNETIEGNVLFETASLEIKEYEVRLGYATSGGNVRTITASSFAIIDGIPPDISVLLPEEGAEYDSSIAISAIATDDMSGVESVEYRIDGGDWRNLSLADSVSGRYSANWNPPSGAGGEHVIAFRATDRSGNSSEEQSVTFTVQSDSVPPLTALNLGEPKFDNDNVVYISGNTLITLSATDDDSGLASTVYRVDGGNWVPYVHPFGLSALTDGEHVLGYRSTDIAGNVEDEKVLNFVIDNMSPTTTFSLGNPKHVLVDGKTYITTNTEVNLIATDNLSGVAHTEYRLDSGDWLAYVPFVIESEGLHLIEYRSSDNVGNIENLSSISVVVDNAAPLSEINVGEPTYESDTATLFVTGNTLFTITASDSLSGVRRTEYRIDGNQWVTYAPFQISDEGEHLVEYRSIDNVGNVEEVRSLDIIVDNTPPVSTLSAGVPKYTVEDSLFITTDTAVTITASDNLAGVAAISYSLDGGEWTDYAAFKIAGEGSHRVDYRSEDNLGNIEQVETRTLIVDNTPPVSKLDLGIPKYEDGDVRLFVNGITPFTLSVSDELSGVADASYVIDGGESQPYRIFTIPAEGEHVIAYGAVDNVENAEMERQLAVIVDNTAPETALDFAGQVYRDGDTIFITKETGVTLSATDNLSGVKESYYLLDDGTEPETYAGLFNLDAAGYGHHIVRFYSRDNVENEEEVKTVNVVVIGMDVTAEVLNMPRALVWTADPSKLNGSSRKDYSLDDIKAFIGSALGDEDIYYSVLSDRDAFKSEFRSGIYNIFVIVDEDNPFGAQFTKEMREAVNGGAGLVISGWGNNITPRMEDIVGLNFKGSLSMDEDEKVVQLYASDISGEETLTARGKILKTGLDGALLAGIVKGNEVCEGTRSIKLDYPVDLLEGDVVSVRLIAKDKGKKVTVVDEETLLVTALPITEIFNNPGSESGDVAITAVSADGVGISIGGFAEGFLAAEYDIEVIVNHEDGSVDETGAIRLVTGCEGAPEAGMQAGPFTVAEVNRAVTTDLTDQSGQYLENLPALVTNEYGKGRAVMFTFNIVESAMNGDERFATILRNAVNYAKPGEEVVEAADVLLLEKKLTLYGSGMDIRTQETLDERLDYLQLFDLNRDRLEYTFSLADGESHSYRYFIRMPDLAGDFFTETRVEIMTGGAYQLFDSYEDVITVPDASYGILDSALAWMESKRGEHPDEGDKISELKVLLEGINSQPRLDEDDLGKAIHDTVQFIDKLKQLSFDTSELRLMLDAYIKVLASNSYSLKL